jgi:hypothetical protein
MINASITKLARGLPPFVLPLKPVLQRPEQHELLHFCLQQGMLKNSFLDSSARPFSIDEYLCIKMDKYASTKRMKIGNYKIGAT